MSGAEALDECAISLGDTPLAEAFGLTVSVDGQEVLRTLPADGPGIFRRSGTPGPATAAAVGPFFAAGDIVGFLQRGVLLLPVVMPEDGWRIASASDGLPVEHGAAVVRYVRAMEAITP